MKWLLGILLFCFPLCQSWCQTRVVNGVVLDGESISLLKDVKINSNSDTSLVEKTNDAGKFRISIPSNTSSLTLELPGYKTLQKDIEPGQDFVTFFLYPKVSSVNIATIGKPGTVPGIKAGSDYSVAIKAHLDETYEQVAENAFLSPEKYPLSSFVLNANEASYCNVRRFINNNTTPPGEAVRIEEIVNYFPYQYPPDSSSAAFSFSTDVSTCPWNADHWLMRLAARAKPLPPDTLVPNNLVLLVDVSGSMEQANKLPLLKKAFNVLVSHLDSADKISVVVYSGKVTVALPPTPGYEKYKILDVINNLNAGGSTAGGAGIELAFKLAKDHFIPKGNNRVVMATDGDFNVGSSSDEDMRELVSKYHNWGIFLTCIGVGMGNYKDSKLETLARSGQGNFVYIDNSAEAMRIFSDQEYKKILIPEIRNAVFKVIFNPMEIKNYRLIGYEDRLVAKEDSIRSDIPGGEIGYGQGVTAFFELEPLISAESESLQSNGKKMTEGSEKALATVALQYELVKDHTNHLLVKEVPSHVIPLVKTDESFRFAAAAALFGMIMRQSAYIGKGDLDMVTDLLRHVRSKFYKEDKKSFLKIIQKAARMNRKGSDAN